MKKKLFAFVIVGMAATLGMAAGPERKVAAEDKCLDALSKLQSSAQKAGMLKQKFLQFLNNQGFSARPEIETMDSAAMTKFLKDSAFSAMPKEDLDFLKTEEDIQARWLKFLLQHCFNK